MSDAHEDQYDAVPGATPATEHAPVDPAEGSGDAYEPQYLGGSRKKKRGFSGCLAVIVALAVILGGAYFVGNKGYHYLKDHLSSAEDYPGPGPRSGAVRGEVGRHGHRDRPRAEGRRASWRRSRRSWTPRTARPASRSATTS